MARKKAVDAGAAGALVAAGATREQTAHALGVSADTLARRAKDDPALAAALDGADAALVAEMEGTLANCARKALHDPRYVGALIFWLKAKAGWTERQALDVKATVDVTEGRETTRDVLEAKVLALAVRVATAPEGQMP